MRFDPVEQRRLRAVARCGVQPETFDPTLDDLVHVAATALGTPIATVSVIEADQQRFAARIGLEVLSTPRSASFCSHAIQRPKELLVVPDARQDPRFAQMATVVEDPGVRFYAGVPVRDVDGYPIGTLCVIDTEPRDDLSDTDRDVLVRLGRQVERYLVQLHEHAERAAGERDLQRAELVGGMGSVVLDLRTGAWSWSPGMYALAGLAPDDPRPVEELRRATFVGDDELQAVAENIDEALRTGQPVRLRRRFQRADGDVRVCQGQGEVEHDQDGPARFRATVVDVTAEVTAEEEVRRERGRLDAVLSHLQEGVVACDAEGRLTLMNDAAAALHGKSLEAGLPLDAWPGHYDLRRPDGTDLPADDVPLARVLRGEPVHDQDVLIAPATLPARIVSCTGQQLVDDGRVVGAVLTLTDVTERRLREAALRDAASSDALTGVANRRGFDRALEDALDGPGADEVAVLFVDVDELKQLNDRHGHAAGDRALVAVAERLQGSVRSRDLVSRRGGDEFAVLLTDADRAATRQLAERLQQALDGCDLIRDTDVPLRATVGAAHVQETPRAGAAELLALADARMYEAKRGRVQPSGASGAQRMAPGR